MVKCYAGIMVGNGVARATKTSSNVFHAMCTVRRAYSGAGKVCSKIAVECDLLCTAVICLPVACGGLPFVSLWHPAAECNLVNSAEICLPVASNLSPFGTQPQNVICYTQLRFVSLLHATGGWDYIILKGLTPPRPSRSAGPFLQRRVSSASRILVQRFSQPSCLAFAQRPLETSSPAAQGDASQLLTKLQKITGMLCWPFFLLGDSWDNFSSSVVC